MQKLSVLVILPISIGGRLTISSIVDGFYQNNCSVKIFDELYENTFNITENFDLICGYDFSALKLKTDNKLKLPSVNYFSDEIRSNTSGKGWENYLDLLNNNDNYTFYWDRELAKKERFKNIFYLPHFVNHEIYQPETQPKIDVMFAGRLDTDYRLDMLTSLVEELPDLKFEWYSIDRHYKDALSRTSKKNLIKKIYKGFIDNEKDMAKAINRCKIVFNINSQGISSLNYRTFQTVACERLLISDYREELDLFDNYMPYYTDKADLKSKILFYLNNPNEYSFTTQKCREISINKFNSKSGTKFMLEKSGFIN